MSKKEKEEKEKGKSKIDLTIQNLEPKITEHPPPIHANLPKHEFSMMIVAPKGSGKTNLIVNLILRFYKGFFHQIWVCSPTIHNDAKWDVVKETGGVLKENKKLKRILYEYATDPKMHKIIHDTPADVFRNQLREKHKHFDGKIPKKDFFDDMNDVLARVQKQNEVMDTLRELGHGKGSKFIADRVLIILDDQAGQFGQGMRNNFNHFFIKHRHASASIIVVTQAYKSIPKMIRTNCNCIVCLEIPSAAELEAVYMEYPESMKKEEWVEMYEQCTSQPFDFLYINSKFPKGSRVFHNFTTLISVASKHEKDSEDDQAEHPSSDPGKRNE